VSNLAIRRASADDEENIVALWHACGLETPCNDLVLDFRFQIPTFWSASTPKQQSSAW